MLLFLLVRGRGVTILSTMLAFIGVFRGGSYCSYVSVAAPAGVALSVASMA